MEQLNKNISLIDIDKNKHFQTYKRYPIALEKAEGSLVWDVEGKKYIDAFAGIAVNNIGHCHPEVVNAISQQAAKLIHISNFFVSRPQVKLEEKLTSISGMDRVFFCNSGAEAVEGALKVARKWGNKMGKTGPVISMEGCFHGRTLATIATGKKQYQTGFEPIPQGFSSIPFNDIEVLKKSVNENTIAIILELIQGEGGVKPASQEFISEIQKNCKKFDILLITDQIQTGMGRTGKMFTHEHYNIQPDIITLAKALGGGIPIGAFLANEKTASALNFGDHGTTFGGNPLSCAAALANIEVIEKENLVERAFTIGKQMKEQIKLKTAGLDAVKEIRGIGMMIGVELNFPGTEVIKKMMKKGVLANLTENTVIRLVPPLNTPEILLDEIINTMLTSINEAAILYNNNYIKN